jgi:hypothetical protein
MRSRGKYEVTWLVAPDKKTKTRRNFHGLTSTAEGFAGPNVSISLVGIDRMSRSKTSRLPVLHIKRARDNYELQNQKR